IVVLLITGLNVFGIELTSKLVIGLLAVLVVLLAIYAGSAAQAVDLGQLGPLLGDKGVLGVLAGAAIFFWSWDGFMRTAIMASEIKDPRRTIPLSIVGGVAIAAAVFLPVAAITLGVLGADELGRDDTPLLSAAKGATDWLFWPVLAAAVVAALLTAAAALAALTGARWIARRTVIA